MSPSWIKGLMDIPLTRKQLVDEGLGHHAAGAAIIFSTGALSRSNVSSPFSPRAPAWTVNSGMATSWDFFLLLDLPPLPATTISKSGKADFGKSLLSNGRARITCELLNPTRSQKYQQRGLPAKSPSLMEQSAGGSCKPRSQREMAMAEY